MSFSSKSLENDDNDNHPLKDKQIDEISAQSDDVDDEPLDPRIQVKSNRLKR